MEEGGGNMAGLKRELFQGNKEDTKRGKMKNRKGEVRRKISTWRRKENELGKKREQGTRGIAYSKRK